MDSRFYSRNGWSFFFFVDHLGKEKKDRDKVHQNIYILRHGNVFIHFFTYTPF